MMLDLSRTLEEEAARFVRDLCRHRPADDRGQGSNTVTIGDDGTSHVRGGMFNAKGGRDYHLSIMGLSRADVTSFRRLIKDKLGFEPPCTMAEALLAQTQATGAHRMTDTGDDRRAKERDKKAKRRAWARENGFCIICCKNAASYDDEGETMATCVECRDRIVTKRRTKKKS